MDIEKVFQGIRKEMKMFTGDLKVSRDDSTEYSLYTQKSVKIGKHDRKMYFASVIKRKTYVSLHFMPLYMNEPILNQVPPALKKYLTGKTCFTLTKESDILYTEIRELIELGIKNYKSMGWV